MLNFFKCFPSVSEERENICKLNDLKIEVWRNYIIGPNDKLIILSTSDIQIKLKKYIGL